MSNNPNSVVVGGGGEKKPLISFLKTQILKNLQRI